MRTATPSKPSSSYPYHISGQGNGSSDYYPTCLVIGTLPMDDTKQSKRLEQAAEGLVSRTLILEGGGHEI
jgi:hypothetical protein